jgi:succinate dehydrogenase / fumarate reductase membrane anchor subunit
MSSVNFGSKRIVTGAGYGFRDWLAQRVTAVLMALFTVVLLAQVIFTSGPIGYEEWAGIFAAQWMKVLTFVVIIALLYLYLYKVLFCHVCEIVPQCKICRC